MLTDIELERMFVDLKTPEAGCKLIRAIRTDGPVRHLQGRMDTVRTRFISRKMGRALYAESRTVELPGIVIREHDKETLELWPQPCTIDMVITGAEGGSTRLQHTPDLFLITEAGFEVEEWRQEDRLIRLATERPHLFLKDEAGLWHYKPAEDHFSKLGVSYRLRSADEHPRIFLANLSLLADYSLENTPMVPQPEHERLTKILEERNYIPHLELVIKHGFKADHIFQLILAETAYVDLHKQRLDLTDDLIVYKDKVVALADALLRNAPRISPPETMFTARQGTRFVYDGRSYLIDLVGTTEVMCRPEDEPHAKPTALGLCILKELFDREALTGAEATPVEQEFDLNQVLCNQKKLAIALDRHETLNGGSVVKPSVRTLQRWAAKVAGVNSVQKRLEALMPEGGGNRTCRLPADVIALAETSVRDHHNKPSNPKISATYSVFVDLCGTAGVKPMSQSSFYEWIKPKQNITAREGKRKAYQEASIPLTFDYESPIHGVLPHEIVYIDHTPLSIFLKGPTVANLGKPTLTIAVDGALSMARAFFLWYGSASADSVMMLLRDYVIRNHRLPTTIVLDNGKEFHGLALKLVCSHFGVNIRWRRRSRPRDSTLVERALGATEQEVISALDGNTICLKNPRMVSASVQPDKFIEWTLPALHGSIEHYLFKVNPQRIHPRFGVTPLEQERKLILELGAREHVFVRYDKTFKLLTAQHSNEPTRVLDRQRGVFVDGKFYWNDKLANGRKKERVEVRVELWNASVVYVCFRDEWLVAHARDGGTHFGRFRCEVELQRRQESKKRRSAANGDKNTAKNASARVQCWTPEIWDPRLREQNMEAYFLYQRLGMTEVLDEAKNSRAHLLDVGKPAASSSSALWAIAREPDSSGLDDGAVDVEGEPITPGSSAPHQPAHVNCHDYYF